MIRRHLRFIASLLALAIVVFTCTNPVRAQVTLVGSGGTFVGGALTAATTLADDVLLTFGTAGDTTRPAIAFVTANTPDTGMLLTGSVSNCWIIAENSDKAFDFAHAAATDPCLIIHSHNQNTTQWISFTHDGNFGQITAGTGGIKITPVGNVYLGTSGSALGIGVSGTQNRWDSASTAGFASGTVDATNLDTFFSRESAAVMQFGSDVNGTGVAYTLKGPDGITGSNVIGGNLTLSSGIGTGNGAGAQTSLGRAIMGASGTSAQTRTQGFTACESKTLSNTSATATAIANVALASNSSGAVRITVSVQCTDATNFDSDIVTPYVGYVNKATVVTVGTPVTTGTAAANNSGSCTVAPTFVANGNSIDIKVTPVIGTIVPTTTTAFVNVENLGPGAVTCN